MTTATPEMLIAPEAMVLLRLGRSTVHRPDPVPAGVLVPGRPR
ncbi:hypothetical protein ACIQK6_18865 [Streptomyces sp. NPDC091682]